MLDLLAVGPKFTRPTYRDPAAAIDRYLFARAQLQQQTRRPPLLLSIDGTDRQTHEHYRFMTFAAYYADRVLKYLPESRHVGQTPTLRTVLVRLNLLYRHGCRAATESL